ncbi:MAG: L28 family ribosomal protein [bacterium]|nr:L28 family ribosomal protein [bacterium]
MTKTCALCGKQRNMAWRLVKLRGKYNPTIKHAQRPNLQWLRLKSGERVYACTKCIKAQGKRVVSQLA